MAYIKGNSEDINKLITWDLCKVFLNDGNGLQPNNYVKSINIELKAGGTANLCVEVYDKTNFVGSYRSDLATTKHCFPLRYLKAIATGTKDIDVVG